jgi:hypothetical protein
VFSGEFPEVFVQGNGLGLCVRINEGRGLFGGRTGGEEKQREKDLEGGFHGITNYELSIVDFSIVNFRLLIFDCQFSAKGVNSGDFRFLDIQCVVSRAGREK